MILSIVLQICSRRRWFFPLILLVFQAEESSKPKDVEEEDFNCKCGTTNRWYSVSRQSIERMTVIIIILAIRATDQLTVTVNFCTHSYQEYYLFLNLDDDRPSIEKLGDWPTVTIDGDGDDESDAQLTSLQHKKNIDWSPQETPSPTTSTPLRNHSTEKGRYDNIH